MFGKVIALMSTVEVLGISAKRLKDSREILGYRMLAVQLREEGHFISNCRTRKLMKQTGLVVK